MGAVTTMKQKQIGLLQAGWAPEELQVKYGNYPQMFRDLFSDHPELVFTDFNVTENKYPCDLHDFDAYLITGSQFSTYDNEDWIRSLSQWILACFEKKIPMVGICYGHQLIAQALGGKCEKSIKGWGVGIREYSLSGYAPWIPKEINTHRLCFSHQDQVSSLPPMALRLGGDDFCENQMYHIEDHVYCMQGHPEFSKSYMHDLLMGRKDRIAEPAWSAAVDSLKGENDSRATAKWIRDFLFLK